VSSPHAITADEVLAQLADQPGQDSVLLDLGHGQVLVDWSINCYLDHGLYTNWCQCDACSVERVEDRAVLSVEALVLLEGLGLSEGQIEYFTTRDDQWAKYEGMGFPRVWRLGGWVKGDVAPIALSDGSTFVFDADASWLKRPGRDLERPDICLYHFTRRLDLWSELTDIRQKQVNRQCPRCQSPHRVVGFAKKGSHILDRFGEVDAQATFDQGNVVAYIEFCYSCAFMDFGLYAPNTGKSQFPDEARFVVQGKRSDAEAGRIKARSSGTLWNWMSRMHGNLNP
jgi:hypothetical protein